MSNIQMMVNNTDANTNGLINSFNMKITSKNSPYASANLASEHILEKKYKAHFCDNNNKTAANLIQSSTAGHLINQHATDLQNSHIKSCDAKNSCNS
jgi:hypothetical protein